MSRSGSSAERNNPSTLQDIVFARAEKHATKYFSSGPVGVCIVDESFQFVAINDALANMNGLPASEHLGKSLREVLGEFANVIEIECRKVFATGMPANLEIRGKLPRRTESRHWIAHYVPIPDENGTITRVGAVVVELTAENALELSLHETSKKLDNEVKRLEMLLEVSRLLSSNWDLPRVFPRISAQIRRVLHQEYASFALHDHTSGLLVRQAMDFPLGKGFTSKLPVAASDSPSAHALEARVPKIFSKEEIQSLDGEIARSFLAEGLQSLCCVPLLRPKGPVGVFVLGSTRRHAFKNEDVSMLEQVAAQLAVAIENHRTAAARHQAGFRPNSDCGGQPSYSADSWGDGNRQRTGRQGNSQSEPPQGRPFHQGKLCRHSHRSAGKRTLRARKGSFHRGCQPEGRTHGAGRRGYLIPG